MSVQVSSAAFATVRPRARVHSRSFVCAAHLRLYLLLLADHVPGLVLLRHSGGPGLDHLLRLRHNRVPNLLLLCYGGHYRRGCEVCVDGAEHLSLVRFKQRQYDGVDDMYAQALQTAERACC